MGEYRDRITNEQGQKAMALLLQAGSKVNGLWIYKEGWSDARVALESGITEDQVMRMRNRYFGPIRGAASNTDVEIAALRSDVDAIMTFLTGRFGDGFRRSVGRGLAEGFGDHRAS